MGPRRARPALPVCFYGLYAPVGRDATAGNYYLRAGMYYYTGERMVEPGDWTGPGGAQQILRRSDIDVAVLETARGGIVLRGMGYESNDASVLTNVSSDHLDTQGIHTLPELAEVKSVVLVAELTLASARDAIRILAWLKTHAPTSRIIGVTNKVQPLYPATARQMKIAGFGQRAVGLPVSGAAQFGLQGADECDR